MGRDLPSNGSSPRATRQPAVRIVAEHEGAAEVPADLMRAAELAAYEVLKEEYEEPSALWMALVHAAVTTANEQYGRQLDAANERAEKAEAQLAEIGKVEVEWGYWHEDEFNISERQFSAGDVRYYREQSGRPVERRLAGQWREVSDAS